MAKTVGGGPEEGKIHTLSSVPAHRERLVLRWVERKYHLLSQLNVQSSLSKGNIHDQSKLRETTHTLSMSRFYKMQGGVTQAKLMAKWSHA